MNLSSIIGGYAGTVSRNSARPQRPDQQFSGRSRHSRTQKRSGDVPMIQALSSNTPDFPASRYGTHKVLNQAKPATGFNAFSGDAVLRAAIEREAPWAADRCEALGAIAGDEHVQELARLANRHLPELKTHDRFGNRIDWVDFHPSWHELMSLAWHHVVPNIAWRTNMKTVYYARA